MLQLNLNMGKRLLLLLCFFVIGYFIATVVGGLLIYKFGADSTTAMRIAIILQDLLLFVVPAVATAVMVTRQPAELLEITPRVPWTAMAVGVFIVIAMTPAMNMVIWLNENVPLPDALADSLRVMEDNAGAQIEAVTGPHDVANLVVSVLIVGVLAGFSEELFFRGALQRMLVTGGMNHHAAIWTAAAVFSFMHFQFFGFVPRMLLGALFGYAFYWTRSIWVPMLMHITNNTLYLIGQYLYFGKGADGSPVDNLGVSGNYALDTVMIVLSIALTVAAMRILKVLSTKDTN